MLVIPFSTSLQGATITSNAITGNWNSASSWVGGSIPTANDTVVIVNGANITLNVNNCGTIRHIPYAFLCIFVKKVQDENAKIQDNRK